MFFCHQSIHQGLSEPTSRSSFRWCCQQGISAPGWLFPKGYKDQRNPRSTLQETNISHHWKSKIIFKSAGWDGKLKIPRRVSHLELGRDQMVFTIHVDDTHHIQLLKACHDLFVIRSSSAMGSSFWHQRTYPGSIFIRSRLALVVSRLGIFGMAGKTTPENCLLCCFFVFFWW